MVTRNTCLTFLILVTSFCSEVVWSRAKDLALTKSFLNKGESVYVKKLEEKEITSADGCTISVRSGGKIERNKQNQYVLHIKNSEEAKVSCPPNNSVNLKVFGIPLLVKGGDIRLKDNIFQVMRKSISFSGQELVADEIYILSQNGLVALSKSFAKSQFLHLAADRKMLEEQKIAIEKAKDEMAKSVVKGERKPASTRGRSLSSFDNPPKVKSTQCEILSNELGSNDPFDKMSSEFNQKLRILELKLELMEEQFKLKSQKEQE